MFLGHFKLLQLLAKPINIIVIYVIVPYTKNNAAGFPKNFKFMMDEICIKKIRTSFEQMQTKEDLLNLLNEVKPLLYGKKTVPFELKQLTWYANPKLNRKRYVEFAITKKSGAQRSIHAPVKGLKAIQKCLALILKCVFDPHKAATGFAKGKSIVDNAVIHEGNNYVYNIDLKDFFQSIDQARVWKCLQLRPFNLTNEVPNSKDKHTDRIPASRLRLANIIAALCCTEIGVERKSKAGNWETVIRNVIPQGAPTSPIISNIICQRLDYLLSGVAKRFGLKYSRYADDITFSSIHKVYNPEGPFLKELHRIIAEQQFHIQESKTRLQKDGYRKEVTGLLVNEKVNVQQRYIKQLRLWLYYWERYGKDRAYSFFLQQYTGDKGHVKKGNPDMTKVISGKLEYLRMVKGSENNLYKKLKGRLNALTGVLNQSEQIKSEIPKRPAIDEKTTGEIATISHSSSKMFHDPSFVSVYLKTFKENSHLKWTTHPWDEKKYATIEDFIQAINESKEYLDLFKHNRDLYNLIRYFIYNPKTEIESGIPKYGWPKIPELKIGWQFPNDLLIKWCKNNFNNKTEDEIKYPFSFPLPKDLLPGRPIKGKLIQTFENVVDIFKTEIQFREKYFHTELRKRKNRTVDYQFTGIDKFSNLEFYTYTSGVLAAIDIILDEIRKNETEKEILFDYHINEKTLVIDITHINSYPSNRILRPTLLADFFGGGLNAIAESLFSLCDFSVISKFSGPEKEEITGELCITYEGTEGEAKGQNISIITTPKFIPYNDEVKGFTYRLKFPL